MNRSALKTYAPKARLNFILAVKDRAAFFGLTLDRTEPMQETGDVVIVAGRPFPKIVASQRRSLEARIQRQGFDQAMEAMAYTWFNRFVALRYMELHGYLEHGYRVLSHPEGKPTPEILEHAEHVKLPGLDPKQIIDLKLDGGQDAELYRILLVAQCNALHEAMPFLFEKIADETELLLPDNLLHSDSLIRKLVTEIDEADWQQVEIIGWLYQFYISDKKDEVIGKVVKSEDIPAATQLFTPNWIVKYLVQNTLGRQWLATYPDSPLRQQMEYYIEPAAQTGDVQAQLAAITPQSLDPETLTLLDPASGSGHILVEAYDLFKAIYQERGYRSKDIPRLILEKNLFGLEIDDRAAQLAAFALLMKARADDRRIFADQVQPNVIAIQESKGLENLLRPDPAAAKGVGELPFADSDLFPQTEKQLTLTKPNQESPLAAVQPCLRELIKLFEQGKTLGSLIRVPCELVAELPAMRRSIETMTNNGQLWEHRVAVLLSPLLRQAEMLAKTYEFLVTNPPYMGTKGMNLQLKQFGEVEYPESKSDLFAIFSERVLKMVKPNGLVGLMTPFTWMFLKSYERLRETYLKQNAILSLIQPEYHAFFESAYVPICSFVIMKLKLDFRGDFIGLTKFYGEDLQPVKAVEAIRNPACGWRYKASASDFSKIPGSPILFSIPTRVRECFARFPKLESKGGFKRGTSTGNNESFLRFWFEVDVCEIAFIFDTANNKNKWFKYNKGGAFRKWYGNQDHVIKWSNDGQALKSFKGAYIRNAQFNGVSNVSYSSLTSGHISFREYVGFINDQAGNFFPVDNVLERQNLLGFLNSKPCSTIIGWMSATLNILIDDLGKIPWPPGVDCASTVKECVAIARLDWDDSETSWGFQCPPFLKAGLKSGRIDDSWKNWSKENAGRIGQLKLLEEQINTLFINAFGLNDELTPEVPDEQITLTRADLVPDMKRLISYALGCMMGRYGLDKPGLLFAGSLNEGFDASLYRTFPADADGIIPITELPWFSDDATERFVEFIDKAWPGEHLEPNLKFIADSLGANRDEHPRDTIRRYLSQNFYKDHLQTYKRRPIYWLFSSGKQKAFQCLVYLHRYHKGTLARMRTEYVIPLQGKLSQRIEQLAGDITAATSTSHRRKLEKERETLLKQRTELVAFDEKLRHYADQRIGLDLDDGVKVNYAKFGDLLAEVKAVTGEAEE